MIRGNIVDLRPVTTDDLVTLEHWYSDPTFGGEFNSFSLYRPGKLAKDFGEDGFLAHEHALLLIASKDGAPVGDISYRQVILGPGPHNRVYEIGITVVADYRGRGYGSAAQQLLAAYLFASYPIVRVQATTDSENIAEQRALERAGFTREGILRQAQFRAGAWHDLVIYSKLRGE